MKRRPKSVSVIAWIIIVMNVLFLISGILTLNDPRAIEYLSKSVIPVPIQHVISYITTLIFLICGISMLKGKKWGRTVYAILYPVCIVFGAITSPSQKAYILPGILPYLIFIFFLFRPVSNEYFSLKRHQD